MVVTQGLFNNQATCCVVVQLCSIGVIEGCFSCIAYSCCKAALLIVGYGNGYRYLMVVVFNAWVIAFTQSIFRCLFLNDVLVVAYFIEGEWTESKVSLIGSFILLFIIF